MSGGASRASATARRLIVTADACGLSEGVDDGIVDAFSGGLVTSTSLMVGRPAAEHAAELARRHPALSVGLHFEEPSTVDLDDPAQAARAFAEQLERFRTLMERDPTHVDSHHHVHAEGSRMDTFRALVAELGVPLRHARQLAYIGGFYAQWEYEVTELRYVSRPFLLELVHTEALEGFTELACHPARLTGDFQSVYEREREVELATLTSPGLREEIEALGVQLVSFHDWRG
jgi:predicted glycoside hydrolase/deacetylase ChbG (UPF0249 family)